MICPRCGKKNPEKAVTCQECGLKIGTICPRCGAYNKIGQAKCVNCNLTLIRFCPKCKAANFPNATHCRKCGTEILKKAAKKPTSPPISPEKPPQERIEPAQKLVRKPAPQPPEVEKKEEVIAERREEPVQQQPEIKPEPEPAATSYTQPETKPEPEPATTAHPQPEAQHEEAEEEIPQESAKKDFSRAEAGLFLEQVLTRSNRGFLIDISGADGIGKSTIISNLAKNVTDRKFIWLVGNSEPNHSKIPYSFFRDMLRSLFNVPILIENKDELRKNLVKAVEVSLDISDKKVINTVCRLLLNEYEKNAGDIEQNSAEINEMIEKIIMGLAAKSAIALVAEDFEHIDKASFDCIKYLLRKGFLDGTNFLFINHSNAANFSKFFPEEIASNKYLMLVIKPSEKEELDAILMNMTNNQDVLPENVKQRVLIRSKGLPIFLEQTLWLMFQVGALYTEPDGESHAIRFNHKAIDIEIPADITELLNRRFDIIEKAISAVDKVIFAAAAFGYKFPPNVVQKAAGIEEQQANEIFQLLINSGVFSVVDARTLAFKHITLWKTAIERKTDLAETTKIYSDLLSALEIYPEFNNAFRAMLAEKAGNTEKAVYFSHKASDESFALGDIFSYTENQLKVYKLLNTISMPEDERETAKLRITEQIGKVNYIKNPQVAIKYLTESMKKYEEEAEENVIKLIELNGYLSESYAAVGNLPGVLDCAEKAAALTDADEDSLEITLINFSKLDAIFHLGRLEEVVMSARNEILPRLTKAVSKKETLPGMTLDEMKEIEYKTELILAKALIYQGNKEALEILEKVLAKARKDNKTRYELEAMLAQALFATIQGNLKACEEIYKTIEAKDLLPKEPGEAKLQWLFISLLTNLFVGNFEQARNICYAAMSLAKEIRDFNSFSLIKLLSGFFYQHFQYYRNATAIYEEIATYCSENKMATGALYAWYLSAEAELQTGNPERAREIAENAIDVACKPNINNQLVLAMLSKLLAEAKIIFGDHEGAQINIENALNIAEKNDLHLLHIYSCLTLGKLYQEKSATGSQEEKEAQCNCAYRNFIRALNIAEKIDNRYFVDKVEKVLSNLTAFCKLSGINLEK